MEENMILIRDLKTFCFNFDFPKYVDENLKLEIDFIIKNNESIMCGFYCISFIEYMLSGEILLDYTNLFSPNDYKKNGKIIYKYFKDKYGRKSKSRV